MASPSADTISLIAEKNIAVRRKIADHWHGLFSTYNDFEEEFKKATRSFGSFVIETLEKKDITELVQSAQELGEHPIDTEPYRLIGVRTPVSDDGNDHFDIYMSRTNGDKTDTYVLRAANHTRGEFSTFSIVLPTLYPGELPSSSFELVPRKADTFVRLYRYDDVCGTTADSVCHGLVMCDGSACINYRLMLTEDSVNNTFIDRSILRFSVLGLARKEDQATGFVQLSDCGGTLDYIEQNDE